jgi:hypothetical protein
VKPAAVALFAVAARLWWPTAVGGEAGVHGASLESPAVWLAMGSLDVLMESGIPDGASRWNFPQ